VARGWKHGEAHRAKARENAIGRGKPIFGPISAEARARGAAKLSAYMLGRFAGAKHPNWRGGLSKNQYGPGFTPRLKRQIRSRDGHHCQRCGKHQGELKRPLHVHHLDHNKLNCSPENLVAACHRCNIWAAFHRDEPFRLAPSQASYPHNAITVFVPSADPPSSSTQ
jgi:hypothetical protein